MPDPPAAAQPTAAGRLLLHGWRHRAVLAATALSVASGFAQFAVFAALGDVAQAFGRSGGTGVAGQLGLSATTLGAGLGIVRLAALGGLPLSAYADRLGRRRVLLGCAALGLSCTAAAALSPGFWVFVALFALARPLLSAANAVVSVIAAEETSAVDRAKAIALVTAGYGVGAGLTGIVRGVAGETLGFRGLFALTLVPLAGLPLLARWIQEPDRFRRLPTLPGRLGLGTVHRDVVGRLALVASLAAVASFVATPVNGYIFAYAENVLGVSAAVTALVVVAAAPTGLGGLVAGRWAADSLGRRWTCVVMHVVVGGAAILTYAGSVPMAISGYLLGLFAGAVYAPAVGALSTEIFPTSERATAAGWMTAASALGAVAGLFAFGLLADALQGFTLAATLVSLPVALTAPLYLRLPETRGLELEQSAPEPAASSPRPVVHP